MARAQVNRGTLHPFAGQGANDYREGPLEKFCSPSSKGSCHEHKDLSVCKGAGQFIISMRQHDQDMLRHVLLDDECQMNGRDEWSMNKKACRACKQVLSILSDCEQVWYKSQMTSWCDACLCPGSLRARAPQGCVTYKAGSDTSGNTDASFIYAPAAIFAI
jgi:hypothetical protein